MEEGIQLTYRITRPDLRGEKGLEVEGGTLRSEERSAQEVGVGVGITTKIRGKRGNVLRLHHCTQSTLRSPSGELMISLQHLYLSCRRVLRWL